MAGFLLWLEASALGHLMRESGVWIYGIVNLIHILGIATLFGSILILDLRLLGVWRSIPLPSLFIPTNRLAMLGFSAAALSGVCLLATKATEYTSNPFLYLKFTAIVIGVINAAIFNVRLDLAKESRLAIYGGVSLVSWLGAVTCGRMIGYW